MKIIEYKRGKEFRDIVFSEYQSGSVIIICPQCKQEMLVILDENAVKKHQRAQGLYCPNGHVQVVYNIKGE